MRISNGITVYVAAPFISDPEANTHNAMAYWNTLMDLGYEPFCPHLYFYMHQRHPRDEQEWLEHDLVWMHKCDVMLRLPGTSKGADREEAEFEGLIFHSIPELEEWRKNPLPGMGQNQDHLQGNPHVLGSGQIGEPR